MYTFVVYGKSGLRILPNIYRKHTPHNAHIEIVQLTNFYQLTIIGPQKKCENVFELTSIETRK